ncbi:MAG: histidine phosphatase family protein, partial [Pseudomonadota bacterium]
MKRLILMRHAKSDWSAAAARDHDRPLNPRGRSAAQALGGWLRANAFLPDQVQSSTAVRTRETLLRLNLPAVSDVTLIPQLYLATPDQILSCLRDATGEAVLVLGHNPGIGEFAQDILSKAPG